MALQLKFEDGCGVVHGEAYARIDRIIIENPPGGEKNVSIDVSVYASQKAKEDVKSPVWGPHGFQVQDATKDSNKVKPQNLKPCAVNPDTVTATEIYIWLKSQEMFKEAKDV